MVTVVASTMCGPSGEPGRVTLVVWHTRSMRGPLDGAGIGVHAGSTAPRRAARDSAKAAVADEAGSVGRRAAAAGVHRLEQAARGRGLDGQHDHAGREATAVGRADGDDRGARRGPARAPSTRAPSSTMPPAWRIDAEVHSAIIPIPSLGMTDGPRTSIESRKRK